MISPNSSSKHYLLSSGKLTEKLNESHTPPPKIIHYEHRVRVITPFQCDHETQINGLSKRHELEISQKNNQINKLKILVQQKEALLMDKENLITKLQQKQKKQVTAQISLGIKNPKMNQNQNFKFTNSFVWSSVSENKIQEILPDVRTQEQVKFREKTDQQVLKVKEQMKNTLTALSNITNLLERPRRKYKFYFEDFKLQESKKQEALCQKRLSQTTINHFENDSLNQTFIQSIENDQAYNDQLDSVDLDPDQTSADDNTQTESFLQDVINQHKMLKQNLIELEESTNKQIQQMKDYYQKQIRMYIDLLNAERKQPSKFHIDSARTNFSSEENIFSSSDDNWIEKDIQNNDIIDERQYPPDL